MALVVVISDFRKKHWNIGDHVELFGEELERCIENGDVELEEMIDDSTYLGTVGNEVPTKTTFASSGYFCKECGRECASSFGLKSHVRSHKKDEVK